MTPRQTMKQPSVPRPTGTIVAGLRRAFEEYASLTCLSRVANHEAKKREDRFEELTYGEVAVQAYKLAHYFREQGLEQGDRVFILTGCNPQAVILHMAVAIAGLVIVAPYPTGNPKEMVWYWNHAEPAALIVENRRFLEKLSGVDLSTTKMVMSLKAITSQVSCADGLCAIPRIKEILADTSLSDTEPVWLEEITPETPLLLLYSASESGEPHGVIHTQGGLRSNVDALHTIGALKTGRRGGLIIFLSHIYPEQVMWTLVTHGLTAVVPSKVSESARLDAVGIVRCLKHGELDIAPVVPYFLDAMKKGVEKDYVPTIARFFGLIPSVQNASAASPVPEGRIAQLKYWFMWLVHAFTTVAIAAAVENYERRRILARVQYPEGVKPLSLAVGRPPLVHWLWRWVLAPLIFLFTGFVRSEIRAGTFGRKLRLAISGGSRLRNSLQTYWEALGVEVLQGAGTSQTCISHVQRMEGIRKIPETIGHPLTPEIHQLVDPETGEWLLDTPSAMTGYFKDEEATQKAFLRREGGHFYRTGDTVEQVDQRGTLRITGRVLGDRMFNSLGGEKVYPTIAERLLLRSDLVADAMVWGDNQLYNVAIVVPDREACQRLAREWNVTERALLESEELVELIERYVSDEVKPYIPGPQRIKQVIISPRPFTQETGFRDSEERLLVPEIVAAFEVELLRAFNVPSLA